MKKAFLLLMFLLLASSVSIAQLELKPAAGININSFSKDPQTGTISGRVGWQLGGTVSAGDSWYFEGGMFWSYKSNDFQDAITKFEAKTEISGLRIPVMVGYHLLGKEAGLAGLRAFGGVSAFVVTSVDAPGLTKDDFTSPTFGVFAGAGLDILFLFLDLKYEWSLSDVTSVTSFDVGKSRGLFVNLGTRVSL
jgi:hypothetical protein